MSTEQANDILNRLAGFDSKKEILDLWFEVKYYKNILEHILIHLEKPEDKIEKRIEFFKQCNHRAREELKDKFPNLGITFKEPNAADK